MKTIYQLVSVALMMISIANKNHAQSINYKIVGNDLQSFKLLNIRPYLAFFIPPTSIAEGFANAGVDAHYNLNKIANIHAGFSVGTFRGLTGGLTFHLVDKVKQKNHKFILSRSTRGSIQTTKYFKAKADAKIVIGPCLDVAIGSLKNAGFYTKIDIGLDYQTFVRAYAQIDNYSIAGNENGWASFKVQGVFASINRDENKFDEIAPERRVGLGGQVNLSFIARPWKAVTLYAGLPLGVMKIIGVKKDAYQPILQINLGASLNFVKQKQTS
jgi:hypothetical protein